MQKRDQDRETSPERGMVWFERKSNKEQQKVPVVYYLSCNGQLEHPHFLEVPLSSSSGLFLRDVTKRLNSLRGEGMANKYSWSSKRSYKNGFVWQDLSENIIYPCHGRDYILKGSLLLQTSLSFRSYETVSSISKNSSETYSSSEGSTIPAKVRMKHHSWSEFKELDEDNIYKARTSIELGCKGNKKVGGTLEAEDNIELNGHQDARASSYSISEILQNLEISADIRDQTAENDRPSGRIKASAVLMQLIACGSRRAKGCEAKEIKD